jgi:hypothetical protein
MDWRRKLPAPLCTVCEKKLLNTTVVPAKLSRHFTNNHSYLSNKNSDYSQRLLDSQDKLHKVSEK